MVRVALSLFGDEISPRFCQAREAIVVDWRGNEAIVMTRARLGHKPYPDRVECLAELGVEWLVCGAYPREQVLEARRRGIHVLCGASGTVPETGSALASYLAELVGAANPSGLAPPDAGTGRSR